MFDFFSQPTINPNLNLASIKHESVKYNEKENYVYLEVRGFIDYMTENKFIFREVREVRDFILLLKGDTVYDYDKKKRVFNYVGLVFYDSEYSKIIKEELDKISIKYFSKNLEEKGGK